MRWPTPLLPGRLVRRYKRFLADVSLDGAGEVTVHCPNPGRMLGLDAPGTQVWVSRARNPARALPLTLELVEVEGGGLVGINTMHPNRLVEEAVIAGRI
jgi:sugar fermentation stimulation protein A